MRRLAIAVIALALAGCGEKKEQRGLEVLPDMFHTPAHESQGAGRTEADGRDAQGNPVRRTVHHPIMAPPPAGTVARDAAPRAADLAAARQLVNPVASTPQALRQGQADFLTFCAPCHGRDGNAAHGHVARQFPGIPSLDGAGVAQMPDGEIFHILANGRGRMMSYAAQLTPERRWSVAAFVKVQARAAVLDKDLAAQLAALDAQLAAKPGDAALAARRQRLAALIDQAKADRAAIQGVDGAAYAPGPVPVRPEGSR